MARREVLKDCARTDDRCFSCHPPQAAADTARERLRAAQPHGRVSALKGERGARRWDLHLVFVARGGAAGKGHRPWNAPLIDTLAGA
ncbi:hypothetical protein NDU88_004169 [Pleurodeles waltl]|uniref:Uncharacterized protein n=1 Tax=Pleurodeles waltl TaxID=8319 RepID=A0AAV7LHB9_PLEWA|nr:hypothetical protein NDU88_004169 [Pleurodeles waltl]